MRFQQGFRIGIPDESVTLYHAVPKIGEFRGIVPETGLQELIPLLCQFLACDPILG